MTRREAILAGTIEAGRLHTQLGTEDANTHSRGAVDVFGALIKLDTPLIFRPLDGLLGACLSNPLRGVIITTKRPLSVQRFTGAHELGHVFMDHPSSADGDEILGNNDNQINIVEIQANAFASAFLIPYWLLVSHAQVQGWDRESVKSPHIVYQLSLRIGASYEATAIALKTHRLIDEGTLSSLRSIQPKSIKENLLKGHRPQNWFRDVWLVTEKDENGVLEGQPDDIFVFLLNEKSGAGYLWDIESLKKEGFVVLQDTRQIDTSNEFVGGEVQRRMTTHPNIQRLGNVALMQKRPWQRLGLPTDSLHLKYDVRGKESGFARAFRQQLRAA